VGGSTGQVLAKNTGTDYDTVWSTPSAGGGGTFTITQTSHGFSVGNIIYYTGSTYAKATADTQAHAEVLGIVDSVTDANNFVLRTIGRITGLSGLTAGTAYFLSPSTAGALTATEPSSTGQISKPLLIADSTTSGWFFNWRGQVIGPITVTGSGPVTSLPGSPTDGQQVLLADNVTTPTYSWLLQWNASAGKWFFLGGAPAFAEVLTLETTTSTSYVALTTAGPSITCPRAGVYEVQQGATIDPTGTAGNQSWMSYDNGPTAASDNWGFLSRSSDFESVTRTTRATVATASNAIVSKYKAGAGTARYQYRWIRVQPVYLT